MNRQTMQFNQRPLMRLSIAVLVLALLLQPACREVANQVTKSFTLDLYIDFSIEWPEDEARRRLIEQIIETLKRHPYIIKVRVIELGTTRKASESYSKDFDLGELAACPSPTVAPELYGNVQEQQRVTKLATDACNKARNERSQRNQPTLEALHAYLLRPATKLTRCTSFTELTARLEQDRPARALIVTDGRANCTEAAATYQATAQQQLIVIQCPAADGLMTERREALQRMLPGAQFFLLPQTALALAALGQKDGPQEISEKL